MGKNFFQRRKILKKVNFLEMHPVRVHEHLIKSDGNVCLKIPRFRKRWLQNFIISGRRKKHFNVYFDELGSATWLAINGERTVREICDLLIDDLGGKLEPFDEAEDRVTRFLSQLYDQRYITFKELTTENTGSVTDKN